MRQFWCGPSGRWWGRPRKHCIQLTFLQQPLCNWVPIYKSDALLPNSLIMRIMGKVAEIEKWFTHRKGLEFLKSEARLKRRCGQITAGVLSDVERLVRQLHATLSINGQCTVNNLKQVLKDQGLCSNGPKAELVQQIHNYIRIIRESKGLPADDADVAHV